LERSPFNPSVIAELLEIPVEANASIPDARIVPKEGGLVIQFNPTQPRARVRFSIAHELAHPLFSDVSQEIRNRGAAVKSVRRLLVEIESIPLPEGGFGGLTTDEWRA